VMPRFPTFTSTGRVLAMDLRFFLTFPGLARFT
jgi:hypothetical protein